MRTWAEIDLDSLAYNIKKIKKLSHNKEIMAIIKADAYGMGAVTIARELSNLGINIFGVSSLEEAIELRNYSVTDDILILAGMYEEELELAKRYNLQITVTNFDQLEQVAQKDLDIPIHIKVDTGMGRVGFNPGDVKSALKFAKEKNLNIIGIYSHLSVADESNEESIEYTKKQLEKFKEFEKIENIKYIHILNSGGILKFGENRKDNLVRSGIILYGVYGEGLIEGLKRVFTLKSKVLFIKTLEEDSDISYGRTAKAKKGEMIATISVGYADGFRREFSNVGDVEIHGIKCPIVGKVCMDMLMVKIPKEIKEKIEIGDEVIVMGEDIFEKSKLINISIYELFTGLSRRVGRVYLKHGVPHIVNNLIGKI
ncbi:alanine racemase [Cetobacterium sp. 2A]|uniref:alanine racemase n=1 Tax=Cetobacterium sp. 2A TaxID=2754723 RepID=UPI00163CFC20|nr:alanine racemase [Cetobacterium sp. 2A]MBC2855896.1 alanine racemase [Cetobacterium sp. 2A]